MTILKLKHKFENFSKAFNQLQRFCDKESLNEFELQGLIQCFEYTFELSWKTLKTYLEWQQGTKIQFVRDVIKIAYQADIIDDSKTWFDALQKRNLMSHTYDEQLALQMEVLIKNDYLPIMHNVFKYLRDNLEKIDCENIDDEA